jgi:signal peptidase II
MKHVPYFVISIILIALDQISKYIVRATMPLYKSIPVWGDFFRLTHVKNLGAAFSLSFGSPEINRIIFTTISGLAVLLLIYLIIKAENKIESLVYSMILSGAVGNLIDRIFLGGVTDFLDFDFPDFIMHRWPVFNIADSAIVVAVTIFAIFTLFGRKTTSQR